MVYKLPNFESFYFGTYSTLEPGPEYGSLFVGYHVPFNKLGSPTSPQTANQISEVTARLSEGTRVVEVQPIQPEVFETVPKQQLEEVRQLMKLTGAEPTLHAPMVDPAGFTREGWTEFTRQESERHILQSVERAHMLSPKGNIPVTLHATGGVPVGEWMHEKGPDGKEKRSVLYIVNKETGDLGPVKREIMASPVPYYERDEFGNIIRDAAGNPKPHPLVIKRVEKGKTIYEVPPEVQLEEHNQRQWTKPLSDIEYNKSVVEQRLNYYVNAVQELKMKQDMGYPLSTEQKNAFEDAKIELKTVRNLMEDYGLALRNLYDHAFRYSSDKGKAVLVEEVKKYQDNMEQIDKLRRQDSRVLSDQELIERHPDKFAKIVEMKSGAERMLIDSLRKVRPTIFVPAEEYALEKSKETIGNVALKSFKQFGDKAPVICLENFFPNTVFSRSESLKQLIVESRKAFVEKAKKEGISEAKAKDAASKLIGATWDTGHINMLRKHGYGENEQGIFDPKKFAKEMAKETKEIAPFVKHVHITDNFGYNDTHLPPGMGEVPFKDILRELEKAGYSGRQIVEAGGFVAHKMGIPTPYILEALGSPLYGATMEPTWNQMRFKYGGGQGYFSGYGEMLPGQHFSTYGFGFSSLPQELGGQIPGRGQRFSGAPME